MDEYIEIVREHLDTHIDPEPAPLIYISIGGYLVVMPAENDKPLKRYRLVEM